jgi:hypothetical protein
MGKREAKWNEFNAKLNVLLEMMPLPSLTYETSYH